MNVTIDLSEQNAAALEAQARAAHMPPEHYLSKIVAQALDEAAIVNLKKADGDYSDSGETRKYPAFNIPARLPSRQGNRSRTKPLPDPA